MSPLDKKRKEMEIARVFNGKMEQELKIMEYEDAIQKLKDSIAVSDAKIDELKAQLEETV